MKTESRGLSLSSAAHVLIIVRVPTSVGRI